MSLTKVTLSMIDLGAASVKDFGASSSSSASDNVTAILQAIDSGKTIIVDEPLNVNAFTVSNKTVSIVFQNEGKFIFPSANTDDLVFSNCSGILKNYRGTHGSDLGTGVYASVRFNECHDFIFDSFFIESQRDYSVLIFDSDNVKAINGFVNAGGSTACIVIGCRDSGFQNCSAKNTGFGFVILGEGYKSGDIISPRTYANEQGMYVRDSYVYEHTQTAFDINGALGATISRCVAEKYTGVSGNGSFQIKNSTNVPGETIFGTRLSVIEHCIAYDGWHGFFAQDTTSCRFVNNSAIRNKSYGLYLNRVNGAVVDGIYVEDWCLDATAAGVNSETKVSAIGISTTSNVCTITNSKVLIANSPNASNMRHVFLGGNRSRLLNHISDKQSAATNADEGLVIAGGNCYIGQDVFSSGSTLPLVDSVDSTEYQMLYGQNISFSSGTSLDFTLSPRRGMLVGSIRATVLGGTVDTHVFRVGRNGNNAQLLTDTAVATATFVPNGISQSLSAGQTLQVFGGSGTGTISINVTVGGISAI